MVSRIMWIGRATVFTVGLVVLLAVILGVATTALAAVPGDPFKLGQRNAVNAISVLFGEVDGAMLKVRNDSAGADATALNLSVEPGRPPLRINSDARVARLNADRLDGKSGDDFLGASQKAKDSEKLDGEDLANVLPGGTLPSGSTIRGTYDMYDEAHMAEDATSSSISFGYTLPSKPQVVVIEAGEDPTAECPEPGSEFLDEVPEAAPGYLCIYEWDESNERDGSGYPFISTTNRTGTGISVRSEGTGIFYSRGVWAVTAS